MNSSYGGEVSPAPAEDALRAAERECAREPIHIPGAIQPHGVLLAIDASDLTLQAVSRNAPGETLETILPESDRARVVARIAQSIAEGVGQGIATIEKLHRLATSDGRLWTGLLHPAASGTVLLELEPAEEDLPLEGPLDLLGQAIDALGQAWSAAASSEVAAAALRAMTGFDRVMVYRFLPDWSGEVLAESIASRPGIDSFRGLRFPASDIPEQARALYAATRVREIPDAAASPVPIGLTSAPLDLSRVSLRAVSPVHLAYLANMSVRASMSVAVLRPDGALWGLLACHHQDGPKRVGHWLRQAAETLARALSWRLAEIEAKTLVSGKAQCGELSRRLLVLLADPGTGIGEALVPVGAELCAIAGAGAFALATNEGIVFQSEAEGAGSKGACPPSLGAALAGATGEGEGRDGAFGTECIADAGLGEAGRLLEAQGWCGLEARRIVDGAQSAAVRAPSSGLWAVWLRGELRCEIVWAGNPEKEVGYAPSGGLPALTPRRSFAAWREQVEGRAAPFEAVERAAMDAVAESLGQALLRRAEVLERTNRELHARNDAIRFFADAAVHDLREPLWQIQVLSGALREEIEAASPGGASSENARLAAIVEASAVRMRGIIDDLAQFALAGRQPDRMSWTRLDQLIEDAAADLIEQLREAGGSLDVADAPAIEIACDPGQLRRVFQNLFSNAIKYRNPDRTLHVVVAGEGDPDGSVRVSVEDNGLGFDSADRERIFEPFRRVLRPEIADKEGLGLGLAICRRVVEGHGGRIAAAAVPGGGARFEIVLPRGDAGLSDERGAE